MPRTARIDIPDLLQHVIVRGVNRCGIFADDDDRHRFLDNLSHLLAETKTECLAWSLLTNHCHLLLRPRQSKLAPLMRRLLTGYAIYFNRRHSRSGHLFQNRYHSIVCDENTYLLELIRYIHLNPLRAGLVSDLDALGSYPWAGHSVLMGQGEFAGQIVDEVLGLFADDEWHARRRYHAFVADGIGMGEREDLLGKRSRTEDDTEGRAKDPRILGDEAFVEELRSRHPSVPLPTTRLDIALIVQRVCDCYGVDADDLVSNNRTALIAKVRSVICYLAVREMRHSGVKVGGHVNLGRAGVSRAVMRGAELVRNNKDLLRLVDV